MSAPAAPNLLSYGRQAPRASLRRRAMRLALATPVLVLPFLDLACDLSPFEAAMEVGEVSGHAEALWVPLGWGFFAGWLSFAWRALVLVRPEPGRRTLIGGATAAGLAWVPFAVTSVLWTWVMFEAIADDRGWRELLPDALPFSAGATVACLGLLLAWRLLLTRDRPAAVTTALTAAFLANAVICLAAFYGDDAEAGYYVTAYIVVLWLGGQVARTLRLSSG